jgi:predicted Zn-dependent protease
MSAPQTVTPARFLSREACRALAARLFTRASGGGKTFITVDSTWTGGIRWGRNVVTHSGEREDTNLMIRRTIRGADGVGIWTNVPDDDVLLFAALARAEETVVWNSESPDDYPDRPPVTHPIAEPVLWFDATYQLDDVARAAVAVAAITSAESAGLSSAAYIEVGAHGQAVLDSDALVRYYPTTTAQYSVTMRDPASGGSGWAGVDFNDWRRIDAPTLSRVALDKCLRSRNPVAIEPGRYTAVLEPQAVCDLVAPILDQVMERIPAEQGMGPFAFQPGRSKIGRRVFDPRFTLRADPMDPDGGFVPFDWSGEPYLGVNWIENGILKELAYPREYGLRMLNKDQALPNSRAFRLSGAATATQTIDEMIANTQRGVLVTRFNGVSVVHFASMLMTGTTRDGLWLIERGKISKAIKNFRFSESPFFAFNNVEAIGAPRRVFRPDAPAVCPPVTVRDFSFTGLSDAV